MQADKARAQAAQTAPHTNHFTRIEPQADPGPIYAPGPSTQTMPAPAEFDFADFDPSRPAFPTPLSGLPPQNIQTVAVPFQNPLIDSVQTQNLFTNAEQVAASTIAGAVPPIMPGAQFGWNGHAHPDLPTGQVGFQQNLPYPNQGFQQDLPHPNQHTAESSSQALNGNHQAVQNPRELADASRDSCCTKSPTEQSPLESELPPMDELNLSSPITVPSENSPEQPVATNTERDSGKGKEPELPMVRYGGLPNDAPQTDLYSVPAAYGTARNPMTADQQAWLRQNSQIYSQNIPHYAPDGITGSVAPSAEQYDPPPFVHACRCGDACECVACPVHPFNASTTTQVQGLANFMSSQDGLLDVRSRPQSSYGGNFATNLQGPHADLANLGTLNGAAEGPDVNQLNMDGYPASSNDFQSQGMYDPAIAGRPYAYSTDYLTAAYHFPGADTNLCSNINGTCRCLENCNCVGCSTHTGHTGEPFVL